MFNCERYIHISERAMGTKMAPSYANIFMRRLNETCSLELLANFWGGCGLETILKWNGSKTQTAQMTSLHLPTPSTIRSQSHRTYIDTKKSILEYNIPWTLKDGEIKSSLHTKPNNVHLYLKLSSCHPPHTLEKLLKD